MAKSRIYDATLRLVDKFSKPLETMDRHLTKFEKHYKQTGKAFGQLVKVWKVSERL